MSGETKLVHKGRFVRLVFADGLSINWATHQRPDGTVVTVEEQTQSYADGFRTKMAKLAAALEPLLIEIAAGQGGTLVAKEDQALDGRRIAVNLTKAAGMPVGISTLSLHVCMPSALTDAQREQVLACTAEAWGVPKAVNRNPGVPPWQAFPQLRPNSRSWRMGEAEQFMARWSAAYSNMFANMCDDYQAKYPAPYYWFWFYWRPHAMRSSFIPVLAFITLPWRWWNHHAHRRRAGKQPAP
ncbi:MAG TPA: hypothetical protein VHX44_04875 [Planctomycetota bacterium]|nr:hypothetical protein [Planctomycetota bacterium]